MYNYYVSVFFIIPNFFVTGAVTGVWTKAITTGSRPSHRAFMTGDSLDLQRFVFYGGLNGRSEVCDDMYYLHTGITFSLHLHSSLKAFRW